MSKLNIHKKIERTPSVKRGVRIKHASDVRRVLNRVINNLIRKEIEVDIARAIIYACGVSLKAYEISELENIVKEIEAIKKHTGVNGEKILSN